MRIVFIFYQKRYVKNLLTLIIIIFDKSLLISLQLAPVISD